MAFSFPVECKNSNMVEAMAVEFGVKWCNQHGYTNFILELDSMNIVNMLANDIVTNMKLNKSLTPSMSSKKGCKCKLNIVSERKTKLQIV
ncbi:hypothetical protein MTR67_015252 [Solanum verrucosum]|uniref:RNase H type-1 domain-containing protein n=1 Tax=Solanum verrucosum TaxID=315347 RepID=A0AAF0QDP9_SOLVR|nr:hypothetical protein MTR67_015252 [Solanum verrucosum]